MKDAFHYYTPSSRSTGTVRSLDITESWGRILQKCNCFFMLLLFCFPFWWWWWWRESFTLGGKGEILEWNWPLRLTHPGLMRIFTLRRTDNVYFSSVSVSTRGRVCCSNLTIWKNVPWITQFKRLHRAQWNTNRSTKGCLLCQRKRQGFAKDHIHILGTEGGMERRDSGTDIPE